MDEQKVEAPGRCSRCGGAGKVVCEFCEGSRRLSYFPGQNVITGRCPKCVGTGEMTCQDCQGSGRAG
jgi:hypothetical protein